MRSHLLLSADPLTFDHPLRCLCGARVMRPRAEMMVDLNERCWPEFSTLRDCGKCVDLAEHDYAPGQQYLYILTEAPEADFYRGDAIESLMDAVEKVGG